VLYYPAVRAHAKLVSDSGPHATSFRLTNLVDSC
jgi:hypothetical protein